MKNKINFDNNATTTVDPRVVESILWALTHLSGNPSSIHSFGREAKQALTKARDSIAKILNVSDREIVFTSGGTEAMNMLIRGILDEKSGHVITTDAEHSCVYNLLKSYDTTFLKVGSHGAATPEAVEKAIRPNTQLITLMAVNNETGVKTDLKSIAAIAERHKIPFVVDGIAWLGKDHIHIPPGITAIGFSGHKLHAPPGVGFAFIRRGTKLKPLIVGGSQEFGRRSGTENLPGIIGLAKAVELAHQDLTQNIAKITELRDYFENQLKLIRPIQINGDGPRICNITNIAFEGADGESLLIKLDQAGIAVSHGSACTSGALEPSRILLNMDYPQARARASLRFSFSRDTTRAEIDKCLNELHP